MEKYNTGDKVRLMNSVGDGVITRVVAANKVLVLVDGFEIPCLSTDIVVIESAEGTPDCVPPQVQPQPQPQQSSQYQPRRPAPAAFKPRTIKTPTPTKDVVKPAPVEKEPDEPGDDYDLSVAFLPPKDDKTDVYLLNDSTYQLSFCVGFRTADGQLVPFADGQVEADSKIFLKALSMSELRDKKTLWVTLLYFKNIRFTPAQDREVRLALNPIDFFRVDSFKENDFFDDKALIFNLLSSSASPIAEQEIAQPEAPQAPPEPAPAEPAVPAASAAVSETATATVATEAAEVTPTAPPSPAPEEIPALPVLPYVAAIPVTPVLPYVPITYIPLTPAPPVVPATPAVVEIKIIDIRSVILTSQIGYISEKDLLQVQISRATAGLDALTEQKCNKCIIIFGLGALQLKTELQILLNTKYQQLHSQDASEREYHYGAIAITRD